MSCFLSAVKNSSFSVCLGPLFTLMDYSSFYLIHPQDALELAHLSQLPNLHLLLIPSLRHTRPSSTPVHIYTTSFQILFSATTTLLYLII